MTSTEHKKLFDLIVEAVQTNDNEYIELICDVIVMQEKSKQLLRTKGYGWTGLDLYKTCKLIPKCDE